MKLKQMAAIFKALSSEPRLKLFLMISKNCCGQPEGYDRAFTQACECLNLSRATISHHFKELQKAGLILCERRGRVFRCRINPEAMQVVKMIE